MKRLFLIAMALFMASTVAQANKAQPLLTLDAPVDTTQPVPLPRQGDRSQAVAAMLDTAPCIHIGRLFYVVDNEGELYLNERQACGKPPHVTPTIAKVLICQLDASLKCDNTASQAMVGNVPYGQNLYQAEPEGLAINHIVYQWLIPELAVQSLPLMQVETTKRAASADLLAKSGLPALDKQ